jgi:hypothetical protein
VIPEALNAAEARERCAALVRAGEALASRTVAEITSVLAAAAARWRNPTDPARKEGERALAGHYGVPEAAIARILDAGFGAWTGDALLERVAVELGDARTLDRFVELGGARRLAVGPRLAVALASRGVPTTPVGDVIDLLSVKAPVWLKPATGADDLAARFARTVREIDPDVGAAIEVRGWSSGTPVARAVLEAAELVVATGRGETLAELGRVVGEGSRLVLHGPRLSAAILTSEALQSDRDACVAALADDVAFAGQAGCLSPVVAWVEGRHDERLLTLIHRACVERWPARARRESAAGERAAWAEWSSLADLERAAGTGGEVVGGIDSGWSVQWRARAGQPEPPRAPRILALEPVERAADVAGLCARARGRVATVGVAGPAERIEGFARSLALAGVERIAPLGEMQHPPAGWRRDGRATVADLVRWVDREG